MVKAFAPGNVSCIFSISDNKNPAKKGSLGIGFTVNEGVVVSIKKLSIKKNKIAIFYNNKKIKFSTVESVAKKLNKKNENIEIRISSKLPFGAGFGISGACAIATAYTLNKLSKLKKTKKELAKIAHIAEVENGTGLGDVVNQYYGGFLLKTAPSSKFIVKRLPISQKSKISGNLENSKNFQSKNKFIYYKIFGKLDTKKIITNKKIKNKINKAGINAINKIKSIKNPTLREIIKISKEFAVKSSLLKNKKIINLIGKIEKNNGSASMMMLGNAIFSDKRFKGCKIIKISNKEACLL